MKPKSQQILFPLRRYVKPKRVRPPSSKGKGIVDKRELFILIAFSIFFWFVIIGCAGCVEYYLKEPLIFLGIPWLLNGTTIYFLGAIIWAFIDIALIRKFKRS